ncbi:hypothetical protein AX15_001529 [Amanita polypyramis BW_CC]|nr:hypothetical protein AX15_001529 [Amanita polypyramis BW_CC]
MSSFVLTTSLLFGLSWILWKVFHRYIIRSPLDNIPGPPSSSFWKGNLKQLFNVNGWDFHKHIGETYGSVVRLNGMFSERILYVFDPKALHHIVVKDQLIYEPSTPFIEGNKIAFGDGLLSTLGDQHHKQRKILNPVFNVAHMRDMIPIFYEVTHRLKASIASKVAHGPMEIDLMHWLSRTALELIGTSGFGYSFDSLDEGIIPHPYSISIKELIPAAFSFVFQRMYIVPVLAKLFSMKTRRQVVNLLPSKGLHKIRDMVDMMYELSVEVYESKKKNLMEGDDAVTRQIGAGKDILSVLMRANLDAPEEDRVPEEELIAQMSTLIFAAVDTTTTALSRILQLLALHPEVQDKLRQELREARQKHGDLSYDELTSLPYMDAISRETLRLYPPVPTMHRAAKKDMILPLSTPVKGLDGHDMHEIFVPSGTLVLVSAFNSNRNPEIWGLDAHEWKPERWLSPLPSSVTGAHIPGIYSHLMTFFGGSRACIGFKFSQLEMKVVLSLLVDTFEFKPSDKEIVWQMTGVTAPIVKGGNGATCLPLVVSRAQ